MDRVWQYWYSLSPQDQTAVIIGVVVTVFGGLILAVLGLLGKLSLAGLKRLFDKPPTVQPAQSMPLPITIKLEAPQPISPIPQQGIPEIKRPTASPEIPRTPAVEFVARRDKDGRDILSQLKEKLSPGNNQLIVLWGPGGVGKTRLASEAAHALRDVFANRIVWVSADGRTDFGLSTLLDGIATQLGFVELLQLALDLKKTRVRELIESAPPLVVLDNFETIAIAEQQRCSSFLAQDASCPALITTRAMIASNFAHNIPIDAMSVDEAEVFLKGLMTQVPDTEAFTETTRQRIIEESGANPLVMQWVVQQIVLTQEPQTILDSVAQGEGDAAERVFDNSFQLPHLGDDGRAALLALSLFPSGASRSSLAEVAGFGGDIGRLNLAAKSLGALRLIKTAESGTRLLVEGLTRQLARVRLLKTGEADKFRKRFIAYFLRYVEAHAQPTPEDYDALEVEKDNILGAMDAAFDLEDWETVQELASRVVTGVGLLVVHGYWDEALRRGEQGLESARKTNDEWRIAQFAGNMATILQMRGEYDKARSSHEQALLAFRKLGSDENVGVALHQLAILTHTQGEFDSARRLYNESLEIKRKLGNQGGIASTLHQLAILAQDKGELDEARRLYNESLVIKRSLGNQDGISNSLHQLAQIAYDQGQLDEARVLSNESLEIAKKLGNLSSIATSLQQLALMAHKRGQLDEARLLYNESFEIKKRLGDQVGIAVSLHQLGKLAEDEGYNAKAEQLFGEALETFEKLKSPKAEIARRSLERVRGKSS